MKIFKNYAQFYDNLYKDKNYKKECDYLEKIFKNNSSKKIKTILDLGCGTGNHDLILAKRGYSITGVDISKLMLKLARKKAEKANLKINFYQEDIRKLDLKKKFDAVISMFAVMGYQVANDDFEKALLTANKHLKKNGLFIFDIWFGPAVLADKPKDKTKKVKIKNGYIIRKTKCQLDLLKQRVDIDFETKRYSIENKLQQKNRETHQMRFFFSQEIRYFLEKTGFKFLGFYPFLELEEKVTEKAWNIVVVAQAV